MPLYGKAAAVLLVVAVALLLLRTLVGSLEPRFVFFPTKGEDETPARFGLRYQAVTLTTADGERLSAWQLEPEQPRAAVVYFHGNGGNLSLWLPVFAALHMQGVRVLAVDYRGYGLSTGTPTEDGVYRDAEAAVRHAAAHRTPGLPLVFWGRSLGAPIAAFAARVVTPDAVVLESGFPDKASVARSQPVLRALNLFGRYRFSTVELLRDFPRPVLVMHGDADSIVPFALGEELFERIDAHKEFVRISGADHNDFFSVNHTAYWTPVLAFLDRLTR
ncbi:MAG: alpha/beta hydrolase [Acidimicrobiia bacterium]|nr:alpha/beta hydrolase [Acidimicrobiia bacterium]